jgi:hypothetical protein
MILLKFIQERTLIKIHTERHIDQMKTTFLQQKFISTITVCTFYSCSHSKNCFNIFCDFLITLALLLTSILNFLLKNSAAEAVSAPPIILCPVSL